MDELFYRPLSTREKADDILDTEIKAVEEQRKKEKGRKNNMEPLFQSQTEYTFNEYKKYNRLMLYKVRNVNKTIIIFEVLLLIVAFVTKNMTYVLGALLVPIIFKVVFYLQEKRAYKRNPRLHNMMMTHRFYEDRIEQESSLGNVVVYHYQIRDIYETNTNYYLITQNNGTIMIVKENCSIDLLAHLRQLSELKNRQGIILCHLCTP